jgi:hypothetical protein
MTTTTAFVATTTTRRTVDHLVAAVYAAACFAAVLAPALAVRWTVFRTDIVGVAGRDIVAASVVVGVGHAAVAWTRLRCEKRVAARRSHIWIASLNALVVLALSASLLVLGVLERYADEHAAIAHRGLPVVALWSGLQLVAVALAEATGRFVFWWLEPHPAPHRICRWGVLPPVSRLLVALRPIRLARRLGAAFRTPAPTAPSLAGRSPQAPASPSGAVR